MTYTKVRAYTDEQLLVKAASLEDFQGYPEGRWLIAVRSNEDSPNIYDDKVYMFKGEKFVAVTTCTTNPGTPALNGGFKRYNKKGAAVIKANQWCYDAYAYGLHSGRMPALRQIGKIWYHRDGDMDSKAEEIGEKEIANYYTNIHTNTYKYFNGVVKWFIGHWSYGCIVMNKRKTYIEWIKWFKNAKRDGSQPKVTLCIIDEFDPENA